MVHGQQQLHVFNPVTKDYTSNRSYHQKVKEMESCQEDIIPKINPDYL